MNKILETFKGKIFKSPPIWLMRQAGRYLPEYQKIRATTKDFMEFCTNTDLATEATLQPMGRFDLDAAIIFSDILMIPYGLGQSVWFAPGEGPRLDPIQDFSGFLKLDEALLLERVSPTLRAIALVRQELSSDKALIGFAGAPWTVMAYMLQGQGSKDFSKAIAFARKSPDLFQKLCDHVTRATEVYLKAQIEAGAQVIQIFDSWAGLCPPDLRTMAVYEPTARIVQSLNSYAPSVPVISFSKGMGEDLAAYGTFVSSQGLGLDSSINPGWARDTLNFCPVLQGGPSPEILFSGGKELEIKTDMYLDHFSTRPYIFNLGHGILPKTPIPHVEKMIERVRTQG